VIFLPFYRIRINDCIFCKRFAFFANDLHFLQTWLECLKVSF